MPRLLLVSSFLTSSTTRKAYWSAPPRSYLQVRRQNALQNSNHNEHPEGNPGLHFKLSGMV